ncbi:MAG: helix-turn-helix domain-containing protein [Ignavibacteria bacterium]|nr:helix-turn-helix domain-containing protein [Ignavibacteria bacterium]
MDLLTKYKKHRKQRLTQTKIAQLLGVTQPMINQILNGKRPVPPRLRKKLDNLLKKSKSN